MYKTVRCFVVKGLETQVPATGLGLFRFFFGLVILHEIGFLIYFRHLIFDPVPFLDPASPMLLFVLLVWAVAAFHLAIGRYTRLSALANYAFWLLFLVLTPMWQDFDGGFDQLMTGGSFLLIFLPSERAFSMDKLRLMLKQGKLEDQQVEMNRVSILAYYIPVGICLGLLYFDSALHKLSTEFWRNGLGAWLPSTMPYYISAIDMSWLLNIKPLQQGIGYTLIIFQFVFVFLFFCRPFRVPLMLIGIAFHIGIIVSLNIYPFGVGMLVFYILMVPFSWWRWLRKRLLLAQPALTILFDQECPLCNRTVATLEHFDVFKSIEFKGLQRFSRQHHQLDEISDHELLKDLYAIDRNGQLYRGLETYIQAFFKMRYTLLLGLTMKLPGIYQFCDRYYRRIADRRIRQKCDSTCAAPLAQDFRLSRAWSLDESTPAAVRRNCQRVTKFLIVVLFLQLNSSIHYGIIHRLEVDRDATAIGSLFTGASNSVLLLSHTFLGITPHGLYLHDHFEGFNHLFAFSYIQLDGHEKWLPFINREGRLVAPNWGRVQSMWANVAVMADVKHNQFYKFTEKVTAFWGTKQGLDLSDTEFLIKMKEIRTPVEWEYDLRKQNISQPWLDIGRVIWKDGTMRLETPGINLDQF